MSGSQPDHHRTLRHSLESIRSELREHGIYEWQIEADVLLRHVLGVARSDFLSLVYGGDSHLTHTQLHRLDASIKRRIGGEPLAYITGQREFYGLDLEVNESVLIPRQETELLVELVLDHLTSRDEGHGPPTVVDVGTGSGAVALAVAAHADNARVIGVEISPSALAVAMRNRDRLLGSCVEFVLGDLLTAIAAPVDVILSNPPYIPSGTLASLAVEVRREPTVALDGGVDGLDHFRRLATQAGERLAPGGVLIVEIMPEQMDAAVEIVRRTVISIASVSTRSDLMGNSRALVAQKELSPLP
ncbi:MAG: peptide chain release factor N(5)-glutamine methyltransferase [Dehalococcoidia bacterium]|nr:peptide chain release factor N(5)-glutamine methyltransferase [Dehalococcoidia bacterium]